jgi:hypothetical protein
MPIAQASKEHEAIKKVANVRLSADFARPPQLNRFCNVHGIIELLEPFMLSVLLTIWILHAAALVSPGVNVLLIAQMAASDDGRGARFAALGVAAGAALWATSAVLGINLIFQAFPGVRRAAGAAVCRRRLSAVCRLPALALQQPAPGQKTIAATFAFGCVPAGLADQHDKPQVSTVFWQCIRSLVSARSWRGTADVRGGDDGL